ncbi:FeoB-associated Cys-rich membrane protein [Nonlabens mediterrranea]|uniref:FeoB-associated Cys-rich membrane protein n=1 Tax=Nonlabens mediterrranea TaxID=1419947 RepID=A0ABS0A715_9FLAO|nr:FeoB-associated Cys-rich membrane protein [Nonlabens mediterrranea]
MELLQYILVGAVVVVALAWLFRKSLFPSKKANGCGDGNCGCH